MSSNEMRRNKLTGQWVIYAPNRGERPSDFENAESEGEQAHATYVDDCPFCPGNEAKLPEIIDEDSRTQKFPWQTRVVPNKYPVLTAKNDQQRQQHGIYLSMSGYGHHEVIIEHPRHDLDVPDMHPEEAAAIIETYYQRYTHLSSVDENMMVVVFRNHGERAGTSIQHPHSQVVATGVVPNHVRWREAVAQEYFDSWGRCLMSDVLAYELQTQERIVCENRSFVTFVPYAAEAPFEMWIVPRRQQADFGAIDEVERQDLGQALRDSLRRLRNVSANPAYNYVIHTAAKYQADEPHLQWYIQIRPRIVTRAGFEVGSGMLVNPSLPEADADRLANG